MVSEEMGSLSWSLLFAWRLKFWRGLINQSCCRNQSEYTSSRRHFTGTGTRSCILSVQLLFRDTLLIWCTRGYIILLNKFWPSRHHLSSGCDDKFAWFRTCGCNLEHIQHIQWNLKSLKRFYKTMHCSIGGEPTLCRKGPPDPYDSADGSIRILASIDASKKLYTTPAAQQRTAKRKGNQTSWMFFLILPARCQVRK